MKHGYQGTDFGEDLREWDAELKVERQNRLEVNQQIIEAAAQNLEFSIERKLETHWRLTKDGFVTVDVWPMSSKTKFLGFKNPVKYRHNLAAFLDLHFSCK